jgi:hypothetical protein
MIALYKVKLEYGESRAVSTRFVLATSMDKACECVMPKGYPLTVRVLSVEPLPAVAVDALMHLES